MRIKNDDVVAYQVDETLYCPDCFKQWRRTKDIQAFEERIPHNFELKAEHIITERDLDDDESLFCDECGSEICYSQEMMWLEDTDNGCVIHFVSG